MTPQLHLLLLILVTPLAGLLILTLPEAQRRLREALAVLASLANLVLAAMTLGRQVTLDLPWLGTSFVLSARLYHTASYFATAAAAFGFLVTLFTIPFMRARNGHRLLYALMMLSLGLVNGAVFANSLLVLLFFWEGLLGTTYGMIAVGGGQAYKTATKAFIISGVTDLCLMLGIGLVYAQAHTMTMTAVRLPLEGAAAAAFVLMMIGAISKGGAMPFHSWIPDAAVDAPAPFMAFLPASIEKLLGIYLLSRISLDLFVLTPDSWVSTMMMIVGCITLLLGSLMSLVQQDYKRVLSFCAISQIGYMILGIGTALPIGIVGGLFHMINHATYKTCLFLTGGAVEHQSGTTDLKALGGLGRSMPITLVCFLVAAASVAGVPPLNGFFSKELIYDAAIERGNIFCLFAVVGSFFTAASFLRLGHAAFFGKRPGGLPAVKEAPSLMLLPMMVFAIVCVVFGLGNQLPIDHVIVSMLPQGLLGHGHHTFSGWPANVTLTAVSVAVLGGAMISHVIGVEEGGSGRQAADHIRLSPGLKWVYDRAERGAFEPYELLLKGVRGFSRGAFAVDRAIDSLFASCGRLVHRLSRTIRSLHTAHTSIYILWSLAAGALVLFFIGR